jgi:hypothetical protein
VPGSGGAQPLLRSNHAWVFRTASAALLTTRVQDSARTGPDEGRAGPAPWTYLSEPIRRGSIQWRPAAYGLGQHVMTGAVRGGPRNKG